MYIYKVDIENFRNLRSLTWKPNRGTNILFGCNGCGKTNLAEAISLVFSTSIYDTCFDTSDYYLGDVTKQIKITIWLDDVLSIPDAISEHIQHINDKDELLPDDAQENSKAVIIYQLVSGIDRVMEWRFFQTTQQTICKSQDRKAINYIYIDANRQPIKEVGLQARSTLYRMAKDTIETELDRISKDIVDYASEKLAESTVINEYLHTLKELGQIDLIEEYRLLLKNPDSSWNSSGYELGTSMGDAKISFEKQSKGIQNLFLLLLMKKRLHGSGIVFIEELEQNLEPKYQRYIIDEYKKLNVGQLFITSHSPDAISQFNYESIYVFSRERVENLQCVLGADEIKDIYRSNKKELISALMSSTILLVEGDSEYESFPIYSSVCDMALSKYDIEVIRVGGKGKFEKYIRIFKKFNKIVYILLDDDPDNTRVINNICRLADLTFVSKNCYEDLIYPYITLVADKLDELLSFSIVKNKLSEIVLHCGETDDENRDVKKVFIHDYIKRCSVNILAINSYLELCNYEPLVVYVLHDSFTSAYFARTLASLIIETGTCPEFFKKMIEHIRPTGRKLAIYDSVHQNVYSLPR